MRKYNFVCAQLKKYSVDDDGRKRHEVGIEPKYYKYGCIPGANNRRKTLNEAEEADYNARLMDSHRNLCTQAGTST